MEPKEISVIVHEAKGLLVRKKGKHKYHVVFGVGSSKFKTENENDDSGNPSWMTESTVELPNSALPLVLIVKDKDEVLGQISASLNTLPNARASHKMITATLQPHKKCQSPQGTLIYEAWITKHGPKYNTLQPLDSPRTGTLGKIKDTLRKSPLLARKQIKEQATHKNGNGPATPNLLRRRNSRSLSDLSNLHQENNSGSNSLSVSAGLSYRANSDSDLIVTNPAEMTSPKITQITPDTVSITGGTKICIEGKNLGQDKSDIIGLSLCGANCLKTLEYVSCTKLYCTTKSWKSCSGYIGIETRRGGKARSIAQLTFKDEPPPGGDNVRARTTSSDDVKHSVQTNCAPPASPRKTGFMSRLTSSENKDQQVVERVKHLENRNEELEEQIHALQKENKGLKEENETMKMYVDHLVARVMEECPEALSSTNNSRRTSYAKTRTVTL